MKEIYINSLNEIDKKASEFVRLIDNRKCIAFKGEMGNGKTTFIKSICKCLGSEDEASSPTYSIINQYQIGSEHPKGVIYHIDLYRLKNLREALDIGIEEYLNSGSYCFIEWPDIIEDLLPSDTIEVKMTLEQNNRRKIVIFKYD